jgi:hypothetical protein
MELSPANIGPAARFMLMFSNDERLQLDTKQLFGPEHWTDNAGALQCSAFSISQSSFSLGNNEKAHFEVCFQPQVARRYESTLHVLTDSGQVFDCILVDYRLMITQHYMHDLVGLADAVRASIVCESVFGDTNEIDFPPQNPLLQSFKSIVLRNDSAADLSFSASLSTPVRKERP